MYDYTHSYIYTYTLTYTHIHTVRWGNWSLMIFQYGSHCTTWLYLAVFLLSNSSLEILLPWLPVLTSPPHLWPDSGAGVSLPLSQCLPEARAHPSGCGVKACASVACGSVFNFQYVPFGLLGINREPIQLYQQSLEVYCVIDWGQMHLLRQDWKKQEPTALVLWSRCDALPLSTFGILGKLFKFSELSHL